jgi:putative transposase
MIASPRSTYYRRPAEEPAPVAVGARDGDQGLVDAITAIRRAHPAYGYRRVTAALRREGQCVNKKRVQRLMRLAVAPLPPRRASWRVADDEPTTGAWYPNRRAEMTPTGPDQRWVADLTYLKVGRESAFLAVLLDAWSRRVIGYALGPLLDARLPLAALDAALESRRPDPGGVHHADRGTQCASRLDRERLASAGLVGSMSRAGNPYDNAYIESFMKTLKHEEVYLKGYRTMADLSAALPTYLEEVYNGTRLHSALGYLPPAEYEQQHHLTRSA